MKLDEREISEEIPHVVSRNKDRKSLLYIKQNFLPRKNVKISSEMKYLRVET
jgi:hypothetical protein